MLIFFILFVIIFPLQGHDIQRINCKFNSIFFKSHRLPYFPASAAAGNGDEAGGHEADDHPHVDLASSSANVPQVQPSYLEASSSSSSLFGQPRRHEDQDRAVPEPEAEPEDEEEEAMDNDFPEAFQSLPRLTRRQRNEIGLCKILDAEFFHPEKK